MGEQRISFSTTSEINALITPLSHLPGMGPKTSQLICRAINGDRVIDLLFHLPNGVIDRRYQPPLKEAVPGKIATLKVKVTTIERPQHRKQPWRIHVTDGTGYADLVFFSPWQARKIIPNSTLIVSGLLENYAGRLTISHPHYIEPLENADAIPLIEATWPLTAGLFQKNLYKALRVALKSIPELPEWIDSSLLQQHHWPSFFNALHLLHFPGDFPQLFANQSYESAESRARSRLAFDELFAEQLALGHARRQSYLYPGRSVKGNGDLQQEALKRFGYQLTSDQQKTLAEIEQDLQRPHRMLRLLQGDVGSGKTIVALLTMLYVVEAGYQAVLMAPTEILARQHYMTFFRLAPTEIIFLSSTIKGATRRKALAKLSSGQAKIAIGTHALFQEGVEFNNLALAIIDEQHRFGVEQRLKLGDKGENTDILVMTATPIPRTLLLTRWGEMQVSRIKEKPAGRQTIQTSLHSLASLDKVIEGIERAIQNKSQIFWVCPLVTESEVLDLAAAKERYAALCAHFGEQLVGLAHGQQDSRERGKALDDFLHQKTQILVATTVIEVGVDVPNANIMVIEHAERFGLAQLHQLRGRVGRGHKQSYCLLLHEDSISYTARQRLALLRDTEDGFLIADQDFRLRGRGEITGRRQSGSPNFKLVDEIRLEQWLPLAWQAAEKWFKHFDKASPQEKQNIQVLLALFSKTDASRLLRSG